MRAVTGRARPLLALAALVALAACAALGLSRRPAPPPPTPLQAAVALEPVFLEARGAVARVRADAGGQTLEVGTGFFVSADGALLTALHVVRGARRVEVETLDGRRFSARLVGYSSRLDLAALRVEATGLPHLTLETDRPLGPRDLVLTVGNSGGALAAPVIVASGVRRSCDTELSSVLRSCSVSARTRACSA